MGMVDQIYIGSGWTLLIRASESDCQTSWRNSTSCLVSLPQRLGLMILAYGGSNMVLALFQRSLVRPTNTVGRTGAILWTTTSQSPTVVSIVTRVGQTDVTVMRLKVRKYLFLEWWLFRSHFRGRDLSPRNRASISGASKTCGITSLSDAERLGLVHLFVLTIKHLTKNFARLAPELARWILSIYRQLLTVSPVTLWGSSSGETRKY